MKVQSKNNALHLGTDVIFMETEPLPCRICAGVDKQQFASQSLFFIIIIFLLKEHRN